MMKKIKIKKEMKPLDDLSIIERLINIKKLKINDEVAARNFFSKCSYTDIVIYKDVFYDYDNHKYNGNISLENIVALHDFDVEVKILMIKYISIFEKKLKKLFITMILENFEKEKFQMLNKEKLVIKDVNMFKKFENEIYNIITRYEKFYSRYSADVNQIPCWALLEKFTFGMLQTYYLFLPKECKMMISKKFNILDSDFSSYLSTISLVRNKSAHGDILVISKYPYLKSKSNKLYEQLNINLIVDDNGNIIREYGVYDFYSVIIIFKKILDSDEFRKFFDEFNNSFNKLNQKCDEFTMNIILNKIHLPKNWRKINDV